MVERQGSGGTPPTTASVGAAAATDEHGPLLRSSLFPAHLVLPAKAARTGYDLQARKVHYRAVAAVHRSGVRPQADANFYIDQRLPKAKMLSLREAIEARPPLNIDMDTPGPQAYSAHHVKPLNETNAPAYTMRPRCWPEKEHGSRTAWGKTWFQTPEVFSTKVDFFSDNRWPSPTAYRPKMELGQKQATLTEFPAFTMGHKAKVTFAEAPQHKENALPTAAAFYDRDRADRLVHRSAPALSHSFRHNGTALWSSRDVTPGPGTYSPQLRVAQKSSPCFSIKKADRCLAARGSLAQLGPFASF